MFSYKNLEGAKQNLPQPASLAFFVGKIDGD